MIKALTEANRADKGDVDLAIHNSLNAATRALTLVFPSYFIIFRVSNCFLVLWMNTSRIGARRNLKHGIAPAAAIMAIV